MKKEITIYILDDNRYFGTMLKDKLSKSGRLVKYFQSEIEFISRLEEKPDIIILEKQFQKNKMLFNNRINEGLKFSFRNLLASLI
ncbi:MAG: two-component SAPR family response regulator, partial [Salibacteraceae bacterium]